jgi:MFS family permease
MTDKWGRRLFIAGGVMLIVFGLVHSLSLIHDPVPANDTERQLIGLATNYKFNLLGTLRSLAELQRGFSIAFLMSIFAVAAVDLLLMRERTSLLKRVAFINTIWLAVMIATSIRYFFVAPTAFFAPPLLLFTLAWLKLPADEKS